METYVQYAILRTLSYFQVFEYPLTGEEVWRYLSSQCERMVVDNALTDLEFLGVIYRIDGYYSLVDDELLVHRRIAGNELGKKRLKKAMRIAHFLGAFPFVEAVCISGSLSKDFALPGSDLDFFIVTAPNRLWTARNFMHLFRKLTFLVGAQNSFCMNYYMSLSQPGVQPHDLYTAIELATLKPACVHSGMDEIVRANEAWVQDYLPHISLEERMAVPQHKKPVLAKIAERVLNAIGGDKIEQLFYTTTTKRWTKKWRKQNYDVQQCLQSVSAHVNTPANYPVHFPEKILRDHALIFKGAVERYNRSITYLASTIEADGCFS